MSIPINVFLDHPLGYGLEFEFVNYMQKNEIRCVFLGDEIGSLRAQYLIQPTKEQLLFILIKFGFAKLCQ